MYDLSSAADSVILKIVTLCHQELQMKLGSTVFNTTFP
jgi:hypothetical protein